MIENYNLLLMTGGHYLCTPEWSRLATESDKCFKFYAPLRGNARLLIDGKWRSLEAGNIYFISGFKLERHECDNELDVYWVHFVPQSLHMRYAMDRLDAFYCWDKAEVPFTYDSLEAIPQLFNNPDTDAPTLRADHPDSETCRVQAVLLYFLSDLLKKTADDGELTRYETALIRLESSISFMNANYRESPSLEEIAQKSNMAPNYFHRVFKKIFHVTPLNYMTRRRMDEARQLLLTTPLSIKEIASHTGYNNEFYFSRTFKKHIHMSPAQFRKMARSA